MSTSKETGPKIYSAMLGILRDVEAIGKDIRNQQQGFNYRSIDAVMNELHGLFAKHGVFCIASAIESATTERTNNKGTQMRFTVSKVTYSFIAEDGSTVESQMIGCGMDSGDKSESKSVAIALKYALTTAFCIPTEEQKDPDAESHELAPDDRYSDDAITKKERQRLKDQGLDPELAEPAYTEKKPPVKKEAVRKKDGALPDWMTTELNAIKFVKSPVYHGKTLDQFVKPQLKAMIKFFEEKKLEEMATNAEMKLEYTLVKRALQFREEDDDQIPGLARPEQA